MLLTLADSSAAAAVVDDHAGDGGIRAQVNTPPLRQDGEGEGRYEGVGETKKQEEAAMSSRAEHPPADSQSQCGTCY